MARIIAFAGSPRGSGYTWSLLKELIKGAESGGGEVKVYDLNDPGFRGCQGCFHCRAHPECTVTDYLTPFYTEIAEARGVVLASPIYFSDITGQAKMLLDRLFPMLDGQAFQPRFPGKNAVTIFAHGDGNKKLFQPAMDRLHGFLHTFGWKLCDSLVCSDTSSPGGTLSDDLLKKAFAAGKRLAGN